MLTRQTLMSMFLALTLLTATQVSQGVPLTAGLEGYWQFDGNGSDSSGSGRDLGLYGGLGFDSGLFGQAPYFPRDISKFAQRPSDDSVFDFGSNDFTVQVWSNFYDTGGTQLLIEKFNGGNGPGWTISNFGFWANTTSSLGTMVSLSAQYQMGPPDVWHQYTVRRTGDLIQFFYDNNDVGSVTVPNGWVMGDSSKPLLIGRRNSDDHITSDHMPVRGRLDEIAIWNRALSNQDIGWLYNNGAGNEVTVQPPQPTPRPDPIPDPTPTGKTKLVVITHGAGFPGNLSQEDFDRDILGLRDAIQTQIDQRPDADEWAIWPVNWTSDSAWNFGASVNKAAEHGRQVGKDIAQKDWDYVHFIGHSAGSSLIAVANEWVEAISPETETHATFLDAYTPTPAHVDLYGRAADWAEHYMTLNVPGVYPDWPFTNSALPYAHNVDITQMDGSPSTLPWVNHFFPFAFYKDTVDGNLNGAEGYGFSRSFEGGGWTDRADYPDDGRLVTLPHGADPTTASVLAHRQDAAINLLDAAHVTSETGSVDITGTGFSMLTGSPVWMTALIETDELVNFITFEADFTSDPGAEGLLAAYWDNELLGLIDERYVLDGMQEYTMFLPGTFDPGGYVLSFRLDPYTEIASSVLIDNVSTGYATPEPATLGLLLLGGLALLRRRR